MVAERKESLYYDLVHELKAIPEVVEHIEARHGQIPLGRGLRQPPQTRSSFAYRPWPARQVRRSRLRRGLRSAASLLRIAFLTRGERILVLPPKDCLVFEDTELGIEAATAAGMASVRVPIALERT